MASIVKIPTNSSMDYDFIAFSFNGMHSYEDFGIYRVSDGDRYNMEINPQSADRTAEVFGSDGMIYFGSNYKQKVFNISFAFDKLDDLKLRKLRQWFDGKEMHDLWFAEEPYKVYSAKVTGQPSIKAIPFDDSNGRVYKGEGTVQFTAYWPYAHTPDYIDTVGGASGKDLDSFAGFNNKNQWAGASGLTSSTGLCMGENPGDLPAPFTVTGQCSRAFKFVVGEYFVECDGHEESLNWDSKTGLVYTDNGEIIPAKGSPCGTIPAGGTKTIEIYFKHNNNWVLAYKVDNYEWATQNTATLGSLEDPPNCEIKYHYWYY